MFVSPIALKHVAPSDIRDKSAPNFEHLSDADVHAHIGNLLDYNIENWYGLLGDWTFETEFVPISVAEAEALRDGCEARLRDRSSVRGAVLDALAQRLEPVLAGMNSVVCQTLVALGQRRAGPLGAARRHVPRPLQLLVEKN